MSKVLTPILLFIVAIGLFFSYLKPAYSELRASQERLAILDQTIIESDKLLRNYDELRSKKSNISPENKKNLTKILPDSVDAVRLILDIDSLATKHGLSIRSFKVPEIETEIPNSKTKTSTKDKEVGDVGKAVLTIECDGAYENFKPFLMDIERSMTLMDVVQLEVEVSEVTERSATQDVVYTLGLQTYWLKELN